MAVGGFYKLPVELVPAIAALVDARGGIPRSISLGGDGSIVDPCAGDGEAVTLLRTALWGAEDARTIGLWAVELEATRYAALEANPALKDKYKVNLLHGDAMAVEFKLDEGRTMYGSRRYRGASVLYLNAPYHNGVLEAAFLERWTGALAGGGVLIDVLPHYALDKSAATLAMHYSSIRCYRFPGASFATFRQAIVFAVKRTAPLLEPDPAVVAMLNGWAADAGTLPELPAAGTVQPVVRIVGRGDNGWSTLASWRMKPADTEVLLKRIVPWHETDRSGVLRPVLGVMPEVVGSDLLRRVYPMATAPSSAYVGTAIAGGVYNGALVNPDDASSGRPPLLVKGVFDKDHRTIDNVTNKDGEVTKIIRIQAPRLRVTVLDLVRHRYVTLVDDDTETGNTDVDRMSVGDLIAHYGIDLLRVLRENCPLTHDANDPEDVIPLPVLKRPLFRAQAHSVMALVKLLGGLKATRRQRRGLGAYLLGEVGVGKSMCALAAAHAMGMRVVLVTCPPHLIDGWIEQVAFAIEGARAVVLETVDDLDRLAAENYPGMTVAILSESKAKLASAFDGVRLGYCPECNAKLPTPKKLKSVKPKVLKPGEKEDPFDAQAAELARTRATCVATYRQATGYRSRAAHALAIALLPVMPHAPEVAQCLSGRHERRMLERARARVPMVAFKARSPEDVEIFMVDKGESTPEELAALAKVRGGAALRHAIRVMAATVLENHDDYTLKREFHDTLVGLLWACNDPIVTAHTAEWINRRVVEKLKTPERPWWLRDVATLARDLLHLLDAGSEAQRAAVTRMRVNEPAEAWQDWRAWEITRDKIIDTTATTPDKDQPHIGHSLKVGDRAIATWEGSPAGSLAALTTAHRMLAAHAGWRTTEPCGAVLYQVTAKPRRYPLAKYITRKHRNLFELMIADESHQAKNGDSARSQAIRRIVRMGVPTIAATGSVMGGLAADLFAMQWALDPRFRIEFPNGYGVRERVVKGVTVGRKFSDVNEFCRRYGFLKECVDLTGNKPVADAKYGSMSDRVEESGVRTVGYAPGVLPLFVLLYLLRIAVVIHKSDLDAELPPCNEIVDYVDTSPEQKAANDLLERKLLEQIKKDRWSKLLGGKLMGAMAEFPSFLDRASADVGNVPVGEHRGEYRICYPRNVDLGSAAGQCIVSAPGIDPAVLLPKEAWMIETVRRELAEGRNCMVFATHKALLPRLKRVLFEALNEPIALLDASKVEADERIAWINHNVRGKAAVVERRGKEIEEPGITARVLVVNSAAVQTGINNLVWFPTEIWMENPQCDAIAYRQTVGRVHRIGQDKEVRIYFPLYKGTSQVHAHTLLMHKVAVSLGTDGLDASSALAAAGVGEGTGLDGYSVGRLLFDLRTGEREMPTYKPKARQALKATPPAATAPPAAPVEPPVLAAVPDPEAPVEPAPAPSSVVVAIVGATSTRRGLSRGR